MQIWFILAHSYSQGISKSGKIPWYCKKDMNFMKSITTAPSLKNGLLMGRKTFESIGRVLTNRENIIISNQLELPTDSSAHIVDSISTGLAKGRELGLDILWIFGGATIYEAFLVEPQLNQLIDGFIITTTPERPCDTFIQTNIYQFIEKHQYRSICAPKVLERVADGVYELSIYSRLPTIREEWVPIISCLEGNSIDKSYLELVKRILAQGNRRETRNGATISKFSENISFDLAEGFPLLTTKKVFFNGVIRELLWFIKGDTDARHLEANNVTIWSGNTSKEFLEKNGLPYEEGIGGPIYGYQWRNFGQEYTYKDKNGRLQTTPGVKHGVDQLQFIIDELRTNPMSRRLFMSSWNPNQLSQMCLPPCHISYQFYVEDGRLSCMMVQRSADVFLGLPFNIASVALLVHLVANIVRLEPGKIHICIGDAHIYDDHLDPIRVQLARSGMDYDLPRLILKRKPMKMEDYEFEDVEIHNYKSHPPIKAKMLA
jgi:thymidylate synthase